MSGQIVLGAKNVYFMRHGRALVNTVYEDLNHEEFMDFLLKKEDPPLYREQNEITIPVRIDVIYPSPSRRAVESAQLIQSHLANHPIVDHSLGDLIDEVKFSESILSKAEFSERRGLKGCRDLILERWFNGENAESFRESIDRLHTLRMYLLRSDLSNILVITHGWYLTARMLLSFSEVHRRLGDFDKALEYVNASLEMKMEIYGESHPSVADAFEVLVKIFYHQCKFEEAKAILDKTLEIRKTAYKARHPLIGNTLHDYGSYHLRKGEYDEAIKYFEEALSINHSIFGENHPDSIERKVTLASAYRQSGDIDKSLALLKEAEEATEQLFKNVKHPLTARTFLELSHVYRKIGNFKEAERYAESSIKLKEALYGANHPSLAESLQTLAKLQIQYHQYVAAERSIHHHCK